MKESASFFERKDFLRLAPEQLQVAAQMAMQLTGMVWWEWDLRSDRLRTHYDQRCILGYDTLTLPRSGDGWWAATHPDDLPQVRATLEQHLELQSELWLCEQRFRGTAGDWRWVRNAGQVTLRETATRQPWQMVGVTLLIDAEKRHAEALQRSEERYRSVVENQEEMICRFDADYRLRFVNQAYCRAFGRPAEVLIGMCFLELVPPSEHERFRREIKQLTPERPTRRYTHQIQGPDGETRWQEWQDRAFYDANGQLFEYQSIGQDITAQRNYEERLQLALSESNQLRREAEENFQRLQVMSQAAEAASQAKSEFLSVMTHEIRTPLGPIVGATNLLLENEPRADQLELLQMIEQAGQGLLKLINDILSLTRWEQQSGNLNQDPIDLTNFLPWALRSQTFEASRQNRTIQFFQQPENADCPTHPIVKGDAQKIRQIVANYLSNALKFDPKGPIEVHTSWNLAADQQLLVRFAVQDQGPGVPVGWQRKIFDAFTQGDASSTRHHGGTGLGLYICRKLAELMQGEIGLDHPAQGGACFWLELTLPYEPAPPKAAKAKPVSAELGQPFLGRRILLIEDDPLNQAVIGRIIRELGAHVTIQGSGTSALSWLHDHSGETDLILLDLSMPGLSGFETATKIRQLPLEPPPPLLAITAMVSRENQQRCSVAGFDGFIPKPVTLKMLYQHLKHWL